MAGRLGEIPDETKELVELQRCHPTLHIATRASYSNTNAMGQVYENLK